jgi:hypothetical protein
MKYSVGTQVMGERRAELGVGATREDTVGEAGSIIAVCAVGNLAR